MNTRDEQERIKFRQPNRVVNSNVIVAVILAIVALLAIVLGAQAIEAFREFSGATVLKVPGQYPTIQAAIDAAAPGNIIRVSEGIYRENLTLNKPVTLIGETFDEINPANNRVVIDGGGGAATILIPTDLAQMPTIRGFVIQNSMDGIQSQSPFIVEFTYFHSANTLVSYQQGGGGFNRNNVYFSAADNAIRLDNTDRVVLIENNRILYSKNAGIEISLQNVSIPPTPLDINIWNNMILGNGENGIQFVDHTSEPQDTNRRFIIAGNLIANNKKAGIGLMPNANTLEDYSGADMVEALRVFNNTFYGNDYGISGGDNVVAFNNIFANSATRGAWRVNSAPNANVPVALNSAAPRPANSVVAYSLFHNNTVDADETTLGAGVLLGVDPLFEAAPNPGPDGTWATVDDDYSGLVLRSDSPAIDKGVTQFVANNGELVPPTPITGFTGSAPDLGWREFGAPIFPTPTVTPISSNTPLPTVTVVSLTPEPSLTPVTVSPTPVVVTSTPGSATPLPTLTSTTVPLTPTITTTPEPLSILSIDPISAQADAAVTMTITGTGFQSGALVTFEGGAGAPQEILAIQVVNSTTIVVTMNARNDTGVAQIWDIRVTNPDTQTIVVVDTFTVLP